MMIPKHQDPKDRAALAPYNFVPLPEVVLIPGESADVPKFSGEIALTLDSETPLYIRCGVRPEDALPENPMQNGKRQEFFHRGNQDVPVIPGSSFRGMLRGLVEILSFSRMADGFFSDRKLIFRAVGDTTKLGKTYRDRMLGPDKNEGVRPMSFEYPSQNVKGGYLVIQGGRHFIRPAREFEGESFVHVEYSEAKKLGNFQKQSYQEVFVRPAGRVEEPNHGNARVTLNLAKTDCISRAAEPGFEKATLIISGHMGSRDHPKHMHCAIYEADSSAKLIPIDRSLWERYEEDRELTRGLATREIKGDGEPLFYLMENEKMGNEKLVFFGPTMLFRLPYMRSVGDHINSIDPTPGKPDFSQRLFGQVSDGQKGLCIRGRVSVGDFVWDGAAQSNPFFEGDGRISPKILSGPKATSFQMYLTQQSDAKEALNFWDSGERETGLRGFKRYWLQKTTDPFALEADIGRHSSQYTKIRPVRPGNAFVGKIRFTDLSLEEIGALIVALEPGDAFRHQIGMGKPLGMGAIKITLNRLSLFDPKARYAKFFNASGSLETGALDDVNTLKRQARSAFEKLIRTHFQTIESKFSGDFWSIPRLADLKTMMDWNRPVDPAKLVYVGIGKVGQERQWRDRFVLPTPNGVRNPAPQNGGAGSHSSDHRGGQGGQHGSRRPESAQPPMIRQAPTEPPRPSSMVPGQEQSETVYLKFKNDTKEWEARLDGKVIARAKGDGWLQEKSPDQVKKSYIKNGKPAKVAFRFNGTFPELLRLIED